MKSIISHISNSLLQPKTTANLNRLTCRYLISRYRKIWSSLRRWPSITNSSITMHQTWWIPQWFFQPLTWKIWMEVLYLLARITKAMEEELIIIFNRSELNNLKQRKTKKLEARFKGRCPRCKWQKIYTERETLYLNHRQEDSLRPKVLITIGDLSKLDRTC